jgi:hypothetical protein
VAPKAQEEPKAQEAPVEEEEESTPALSAPALPAAEPKPALPATSPVPPALVALGRKVADDHRARTGTAIDASTLRARLGVPMPLAEAIAAQLT